jgi:hypothetical protein
MALIHWLGSLIEPSVAAWIIIMGVIFLALYHLARLEWEVLNSHRGDAENTESLQGYSRGDKSAKKAGN